MYATIDPMFAIFFAVCYAMGLVVVCGMVMDPDRDQSGNFGQRAISKWWYGVIFLAASAVLYFLIPAEMSMTRIVGVVGTAVVCLALWAAALHVKRQSMYRH